MLESYKCTNKRCKHEKCIKKRLEEKEHIEIKVEKCVNNMLLNGKHYIDSRNVVDELKIDIGTPRIGLILKSFLNRNDIPFNINVYNNGGKRILYRVDVK